MQLSKQEIIVLRETFLFHHMSAGTYVDFSNQPHPGFVRQHYDAGAFIALPQETEHCIAIVISGQLKAVREPKFPDMQLQEGFVIGALDLFSTLSPELPPITALTDCDLLIISASQVRELFDQYPEVMMRYICLKDAALLAYSGREPGPKWSRNACRYIRQLARMRASSIR